jgi:hypothetical protein
MSERQRCRNKNCRKALPAPTANDHHAFCRPWCHEAFYGGKCVVCERPLPKKSRSDKRLCGGSECRHAYAQNRTFFDYPYPDSPNCSIVSKTPVKGPVLDPPKGGRGGAWRVVAGPRLSDFAFRAATVPDGPGRRWEGGSVERIEENNRALLRAHFAELAKGCLILPHHPPVNILGGYKFPGAPAVDLSPAAALSDGIRSDWKPCSPASPIADDLAIPEFLRRAGGGR